MGCYCVLIYYFLHIYQLESQNTLPQFPHQKHMCSDKVLLNIFDMQLQKLLLPTYDHGISIPHGCWNIWNQIHPIHRIDDIVHPQNDSFVLGDCLESLCLKSLEYQKKKFIKTPPFSMWKHWTWMPVSSLERSSTPTRRVPFKCGSAGHALTHPILSLFLHVPSFWHTVLLYGWGM